MEKDLKNYTLNLFKKVCKKSDGTKFDTYFMKKPEGESCLSVTLTDEVKKLIFKHDIKFPLVINLTQNDYFISREHYEDKDKNDKIKTKCVITNMKIISHLDSIGEDLDEVLA